MTRSLDGKIAGDESHLENKTITFGDSLSIPMLTSFFLYLTQLLLKPTSSDRYTGHGTRTS